jgi:hypothetical protein
MKLYRRNPKRIFIPVNEFEFKAFVVEVRHLTLAGREESWSVIEAVTPVRKRPDYLVHGCSPVKEWEPWTLPVAK